MRDAGVTDTLSVISEEEQRALPLRILFVVADTAETALKRRGFSSERVSPGSILYPECPSKSSSNLTKKDFEGKR